MSTFKQPLIVVPDEKTLTELIASVKSVSGPVRQAVLRNILPFKERKLEISDLIFALKGSFFDEVNKHEMDKEERSENLTAALTVQPDDIFHFLKVLITDERQLREALVIDESLRASLKA